MGTRGLTIVVESGAVKVAQYGQWDHYPDGQGKDIITFLMGDGNVGRLRAGLKHTYQPTDDQVKAMWKEAGHDGDSGWVTFGISKRMSELYPSMTRDTGGGILGIIASADEDHKVPLHLATSFAGNSLFCEWAYVVDLDHSVLEIYQGFNKEPTPPDSRFPSGASWLEHEGEYEPVKLLTSFKFDELEDDSVSKINELAYPDN